jgi:hypothetical protein
MGKAVQFRGFNYLPGAIRADGSTAEKDYHRVFIRVIGVDPKAGSLAPGSFGGKGYGNLTGSTRSYRNAFMGFLEGVHGNPKDGHRGDG